jgi:heme-degrading monooxygenase HmoA
LRNIKNNEGHFTLITYWENLNVIKNFAGEDFEKAKYYPEDDNFLLEFEEKVEHFEVFS